MAFIEGIAYCGADLWRCCIFVYFVLRIRVAEIKEILSEKKVIFLKNSGRQLILSAVKLCGLSLSKYHETSQSYP